MDERHAWWLAALIDGEGSIIIRQKPDRPHKSVWISIAQNDRRILDRAAEYMGCGRIYGGIGPLKNGHQLQLHPRAEVFRILQFVEPLLVLKGEKAAEGIKVLASILGLSHNEPTHASETVSTVGS